METLQSTLKQREGENHQLQWELSRLQTDRNFLMAEVSKLTLELETVRIIYITHLESIDSILVFCFAAKREIVEK